MSGWLRYMCSTSRRKPLNDEGSSRYLDLFASDEPSTDEEVEVRLTEAALYRALGNLPPPLTRADRKNELVIGQRRIIVGHEHNLWRDGGEPVSPRGNVMGFAAHPAGSEYRQSHKTT